MAINIVSFIEFLMECCTHADIFIIIAERYMIYRDTAVWEKFTAKKFCRWCDTTKIERMK